MSAGLGGGHDYGHTESLTGLGARVLSQLGERAPIDLLVRGFHTEHGLGAAVAFLRKIINDLDKIKRQHIHTNLCAIIR